MTRSLNTFPQKVVDQNSSTTALSKFNWLQNIRKRKRLAQEAQTLKDNARYNARIKKGAAISIGPVHIQKKGLIKAAKTLGKYGAIGAAGSVGIYGAAKLANKGIQKATNGGMDWNHKTVFNEPNLSKFIFVDSFWRKNKSGKRTRVRAHNRKGLSDTEKILLGTAGVIGTGLAVKHGLNLANKSLQNYLKAQKSISNIISQTQELTARANRIARNLEEYDPKQMQENLKQIAKAAEHIAEEGGKSFKSVGNLADNLNITVGKVNRITSPTVPIIKTAKRTKNILTTDVSDLLKGKIKPKNDSFRLRKELSTSTHKMLSEFAFGERKAHTRTIKGKKVHVKRHRYKKKDNRLKNAALSASVFGLGTVATIIGLRKRYIANMQKSVKEIAELAKNINVDDLIDPKLMSPNKTVTFVSAGLTGTKNYVKSRDKIIDKLKLTLNDPNQIYVPGKLDYFLQPTATFLSNDKLRKKVTHTYGALYVPIKTLIHGKNPDAIRTAAEVIAIKNKYGPSTKINMVGHSGGGITYREANLLLQKMGINDVKSVAIGSPTIGMLPSPKNHTHILDPGDIIAAPYQFGGDKIYKIKDGKRSHNISQYFESKDFKDILRRTLIRNE